MKNFFFRLLFLVFLVLQNSFAYVPVPEPDESAAQANQRFMEFLFTELDFLSFETGEIRDLYSRISSLPPQEGKRLFSETCVVFKSLLYQISEHKVSDFHQERFYLPALGTIYHEYLHLNYRLRGGADRSPEFALLLKNLSKEAYKQEIHRHLQTADGVVLEPDRDELRDLLDLYAQEEIFSFFTGLLLLGVEKSYAVLDFNMNPENFTLDGLREFGDSFAFPPDSALQDFWAGDKDYPFTEMIFAGERLKPVKRLKLSLEAKEKLFEFILPVGLVKDTGEIVSRLNGNKQLRLLLDEVRKKYLQQRLEQMQNDFSMDDDSIFVAD
jgi:hypothetical protein